MRKSELALLLSALPGLAASGVSYINAQPQQTAWSLLGTWSIRLDARIGHWSGTIDLLKGSGETGVYDAKATLDDQSHRPVIQAYHVRAENEQRTALRFDGYNVTGDPRYCPDVYHVTLGPDGRSMQGSFEDRCGNRGSVMMKFVR